MTNYKVFGLSALVLISFQGPSVHAEVSAYEKFKSLQKEPSTVSDSNQGIKKTSKLSSSQAQARKLAAQDGPKVAEATSVPSTGPAANPTTAVTTENAKSTESANPGSTAATSEEKAPEEFSGDDYLTGDWGGARARAAKNGASFELIYKGEYGKVTKGGVDQKESYLENLDVKFSLDLDKSMGWSGWSFFIYGLGNKGADSGKVPSVHVGDRQVTSNIEAATDDFHLYGLHLQKNWNEDKVSLLAGLFDLNSEFYVTDASGVFLNASFGVGHELAQTGVNGPSIFPYTAPAVRLRVIEGSSYLQSAIFSAQAGDPVHPKSNPVRWGAAEGSLVAVEAGHEIGDGDRKGKFALGGWFYTRTFDNLNSSLTNANAETVAEQETNNGLYLLLDVPLTEKLNYFLRYGVASPNVNETAMGYATGFNLVGLLPGRDKDVIGLAVAKVYSSSIYREVQLAGGTELNSSETSLEFTYRWEFGNGVALQPDIQLIQSPNYSTTTPDATIGSLRLEVNF